MKRWAAVTVGLYAAVVVALTPVVLVAAVIDEVVKELFAIGGNDVDVRNLLSWDVLLTPYTFWQYWLVIALLILAQAALLVIPVKRSLARPVKKRHIRLTLVVAALLMGVLVLLAAANAAFALSGDDPAWPTVVAVPTVALASWAGWFFAFRAFYHGHRLIGNWMSDMMRILYWGSILELLTAVCAHVVVRRRDDCCAPVGTAIGMGAGAALAVMAFGPGVFYLFAARARRIAAKAPAPEDLQTR